MNIKCTKRENILCRFCSLHHKFVSREAERRREYLPDRRLVSPNSPYFIPSPSVYKSSSSRISSTRMQCNSCIIGQIYRNLTIFFSLKIKSNQRQEQQLSESTNDFSFQFRSFNMGVGKFCTSTPETRTGTLQATRMKANIGMAD